MIFKDKFFAKFCRKIWREIFEPCQKGLMLKLIQKLPMNHTILNLKILMNLLNFVDLDWNDVKTPWIFMYF